ncbi:DUF502 domain-containing protein [Singulisphaera sp. PoT]|uniref:DUF502 domain-containing protein n=1 Tax=Singulisphaera sp. PoT TaxID=3411797 RepID=UPI003BF45F67
MEPKPSPHQDLTADAEDVSFLHTVAGAIRTRIIGGLLLALPIVLTFWIIYWLYSTLLGLVLTPMTWLYQQLMGIRPTPLWERFAAPLIAIFLALSFLYFLGLFVRSSLLRAVDWILLRVPIVTIIYKSLRNVAQSLSNQGLPQKFKRVVLVEFPHPGMRALAFVTNSLRDEKTGRTILTVCVLTGVVPPAGFTLFVPEEEVTDLNWTVNQTIQAILSGGITSPPTVGYFHPMSSPVPSEPSSANPRHSLEPTEEFPTSPLS